MRRVLLIILMLFIASCGTENLAGDASLAGLPQCADRIDNDGDGYCDWEGQKKCKDGSKPGDPDCTDRKDNSEAPDYVDSCTDTDGGQVYDVLGLTFGTLNGLTYNHSDECIDDDVVMEYFCKEVYAVNEKHVCGEDFTSPNYCWNGSVFHNTTNHFCSNGACDVNYMQELVEFCPNGCTGGVCDEAPPADSCTSTDGGDPFVFGAQWGWNDGNHYNVSDVCLNNITLGEFYCEGVHLTNWTYDCTQNGTWCVQGACYR